MWTTHYYGRYGLCTRCRKHRPSSWMHCPECGTWCGKGCEPERCWHSRLNCCRQCARQFAREAAEIAVIIAFWRIRGQFDGCIADRIQQFIRLRGVATATTQNQNLRTQLSAKIFRPLLVPEAWRRATFGSRKLTAHTTEDGCGFSGISRPRSWRGKLSNCSGKCL